MNPKALTIALRLAAVTAALGAMGACHISPRCPGDGWSEARVIDLGVGSDLHAVAAVAAVDAYRNDLKVAVGSAGTVVVWGIFSNNGDSFVEQSTVPVGVDLRGVTQATGGTYWVVGDSGVAATSDDLGQTWTTLDLGTTADLHAVAWLEGGVVMVGDDVVRVFESGIADDTWVEPPTPTGGWGQLRGLAQTSPAGQGPRFFAVGLNGVIWSTDDLSGAWVAEDSGVSVDLLAVGVPPNRLDQVVAVGTDGTFLVRDIDGWSSIETETTADFIDYISSGVALSSDGAILVYDASTGLEQIDSIVGARAIANRSGLIAVGDEGMAVKKDFERFHCR